MKSMKSSKKNMTITTADYIKAIKRADREFEIETYGKQVSMCGPRFHKSKRDYSRKNYRVSFDD